jgi:hypothetical protein
VNALTITQWLDSRERAKASSLTMNDEPVIRKADPRYAQAI